MIVSVNHNEYADIQKFIAQPWKPSLEIFATWFLHTGIPFEMKETGPNLSVMCVTIEFRTGILLVQILVVHFLTLYLLCRCNKRNCSNHY